jgi:hypothetical protein
VSDFLNERLPASGDVDATESSARSDAMEHSATGAIVGERIDLETSRTKMLPTLCAS